MVWKSLAINTVIAYNWLIIFYFLTINSIYLLLLIVSFRELYTYVKRIRYGEYQEMLGSAFTPPVSVIIPAHNEELTIVESVKSMMMLHYPEVEVVVVNDGSNDRTLQVLIDAFELQKTERVLQSVLPTKPIRAVYESLTTSNVVVVDKENGGKADALNAGINVASHPLICSVDADSLLEEDALLRVVRPYLERPDEVVAVGGIVRIVNGCTVENGRVVKIGLPRKPLAILQIIEYLRAFLSGRIGWSVLRSLLIISGAFGLFKKSVVLAVGGYSPDTVGEDMELVVKIHEYLRRQKQKYRMVFIPDPVCWTQVPETLASLRTQRKRWYRGMVQTLLAYKKMFANPRYGVIGLFAVPYFWIFEMFGPVVEFTGYITIILSFILGILDIDFAVLFACVAILYGIVLSVGAVLLEEFSFQRYPSVRDLLRLIFYGIVENFGYRQLNAWWRINSLLNYHYRHKTWGTVQRQSFARPLSN